MFEAIFLAVLIAPMAGFYLAVTSFGRGVSRTKERLPSARVLVDDRGQPSAYRRPGLEVNVGRLLLGLAMIAGGAFGLMMAISAG
ncbi:MAG: hypothetical protein R3B48_29260 [Kofleriaceae bacterium]